MKVSTLRAFAVVRDGEAAARLERIFFRAPDRELVAVTASAGGAFDAIVAARVQSVYVQTEVRGTHALLKRLRRSWRGFIRAFCTSERRETKAGCPVVPFAELVSALEAMYPVDPEATPPSLDFQNLVLDSLYLRERDGGFVILTYDGDVVFYGPQAAALGHLPYPPPPGLTEADVHQLIATAHRRDVVTSDDGRAFAERFWVRPRDRGL